MRGQRTSLLAWVIGLLAAGQVAAAAPETVYFPSADGSTELAGYLYAPEGAGKYPAVVLLHGRGGLYTGRVNAGCTTVARGTTSPCNAQTLSARHDSWGRYWADHGYLALLVDSYGPRDRAHGYGRKTHGDPARAAVHEATVRPLDAEGGLAYLVQRPDVRADRVMLQGWSNGGSTTLNVLHRQATGQAGAARFRAALAFYPGCGKSALLALTVRLDVPLWLLLASADEEVSPHVCRAMAERADSTAGAPVVRWYDGASHGFDDPGKDRQAVASNRLARADALHAAARYFEALP